MGKKSLIKSTSSKKAAPKDKQPTETKQGSGQTQKAAAPSKASVPPQGPVDVKGLLFRSFEPLTWPAPFSPPLSAARPTAAVQGLIAADDPQKVHCLKAVLGRRFSTADLVAAAEKAKAERVAAEKAKAERVAAEKAEAERVAAEKAEAERVAAEKAEAERVAVSYPSVKAKKASWLTCRWSVSWPLVGLGAAVVFVFLLIIGGSISNMDHFYLKAHPKGVEVWQGKFAPIGQKELVVLDGIKAPTPLKKRYTKAEVFPLIYSYYVGKADALLSARTPDLEKVKGHLKTAAAYAVNPAIAEDIAFRTNHIELMLLLYKADVAARRGSPADLKAAMGYLDEAALLKLDDAQYALVEQRTTAVKQRMAQGPADAPAKP